ncbi:hypothetical protein HXX76_012303 [Chlamydomonas incerta]|uniref:Methyltransferase type 12 domain-containing protein n=1 Tax=Chlamydomonas incerta TaxID=51695 RepID=A0A835SSV7_CHLIN|nr:hypothetical protein HXX76_012303 [Chlamydomonas incerta]|eukprot:KAG2427654.1 hypothetical protein HXX76_012303 [Chlamydomonas incerta]
MVAAHAALGAIAGRPAHASGAHPPRHPPPSHHQQPQQQPGAMGAQASWPQPLTVADPGHEQLSAASSASLSLSPAASLYAPDGTAVSPHGAAAFGPAPLLPLEGELAAFSATASPYRISGSGAGGGPGHAPAGGGGGGGAAAGPSGGAPRDLAGAAAAAAATAAHAPSPEPLAGAASGAARALSRQGSAAAPDFTAPPAGANHPRLPHHLPHTLYPHAQQPGSTGAAATMQQPAPGADEAVQGAVDAGASAAMEASSGEVASGGFGGNASGRAALPVAEAAAGAAAATAAVASSAAAPLSHTHHHSHSHPHQQQHPHHQPHQQPQHHLQHHGLRSTHDPTPPVRAHASAQPLAAHPNAPHQHQHQHHSQHPQHPHPHPHPHQQQPQAAALPPLPPAPAPAAPHSPSPRIADGVRPAAASGSALAVQGILPSPASEEEEVLTLLLGAQGGSSGRVSALDVFRRSYRVVRAGAATAAPTASVATAAAATAAAPASRVAAGDAEGAGRDNLAVAPAAAAPPAFPPQQPQQPQQPHQPLGRVSSSGASADSQSCSPAHSNSNSQLLLRQQLHSIDAIHQVFGSSNLASGADPFAPNPKLIAAVAGTGLAPWEIHRPQKFVRDLVLRGCFAGRVLDAGCGIGDNALFIAKACPQAHVTAVDVVQRCLDFANTKAGLRGLPASRLELAVADLRQPDSLPDTLTTGATATGTATATASATSTGAASATASATSTGAAGSAAAAASALPLFDVVLDAYTFHSFNDADRQSYLACLRRLLRPGGLLYMSCMSEAETRPGGPRRVSEAELRSVAHPGTGWQVEGVEETHVELHPTFWGGRAPAHLFTVRRL